ncbi:MAG: hypothetical protein Q6363_008295 [Candidatus Njordarchaeota archaeon]
MRHKYRLVIPIDKENIQKLKQFSRKIVEMKGAIDGPEIIIDETIMDDGRKFFSSDIFVCFVVTSAEAISKGAISAILLCPFFLYI